MSESVRNAARIESAVERAVAREPRLTEVAR